MGNIPLIQQHHLLLVRLYCWRLVMANELWSYLEPMELKRSRSSRVCITCQHFRFSVDGDGHTVLACGWKQRLIVSGDHLTRRCDQWLVRRELEQGWCPEVA